MIRYLDFRDSKIRATKSASQDEDEVLESAGNLLFSSLFYASFLLNYQRVSDSLVTPLLVNLTLLVSIKELSYLLKY